jgi:outer membrane biosynthesis protein TonB
VFDAPRGGHAPYDSPRGAPATFDAPRGGPASFDAPRGGFDPSADAARRAAAGRQAVVIDQAMRPPVPVAPAPQPAPAAHSGFPNGGAGAAMPAPITPVAAPPRRSAMGGVIGGVVVLALLGTAGAAAYIYTRTPVEESPERVDKVMTEEQPAEEAPAEAAPAEEAPPEEAAPVEAAPEPTPEVAEAAPPVEPEPVVEKAPEPPPKPATRSSSRSSRSASKPAPAPSTIEVPEAPPATKSVAATKTTTAAKTTAPEVSDDDLLGSTTPTSKPPPAVVPPPPVPDEEPEALDTLPLTVLDTIVRNNKNIKRCFFNEQQKTGVLPSVSVKMKIETNGSVSSAAIAEPAAQQGTELDACLSTAFKGLQFPAFKTPMGAVTYPFKF